MKTKILLVDDEKLERILIRKSYDWEANGFEIIGEASSGEEALAFFDTKEPEIVFTDINMPYMDGLALAEKINERAPKCRVVIVTGYRDFEYARRAIQLGVRDFILKPVNIADVVSLAESIRAEQDLEKGKEEEIHRLMEHATDNQSIVIESFLQRLVESHIEEEEATHKLQMYSFEGLLENCVCIDIKPESDSKKDAEMMVNSRKILEIVKRNQSKEQISFIHYLCNVVVYLYGNEVYQAMEQATKLKAQIKQELNMEVSIGISQIGSGFQGISGAYRQAEKAISLSAVFGKNTCIPYEEYQKIKNVNQSEIKMNWKEFVFHVENSFKESVDASILQYIELLRETGITDTNYLKLMVLEMVSKTTSVLTRRGKSLEQIMGTNFLYEQINEINTIDDLMGCLQNLVYPVLEYSDKNHKKKTNKLVEQAIECIGKNLCQPDLTLKTVASQIFANESYLSRIFKQEMEESLIEYITRRRIEKSIELLNDTDLKVYEIAEQVGFNNSHYFSICFKKHVGVTIKEYKKTN